MNRAVMSSADTLPSVEAMITARRRDRRVYWRSHPVLFPLLAAARRAPTVRVGRTLLVHGADEVRQALTQLPLDRRAAGTTGGAAAELIDGDVLFDQQGDAHRQARRTLAVDLGSAGVDRLRPVWTQVLARRLTPLAAGDAVDLVDVVAELSGATACAMLGVPGDARLVAEAARAAAAAAARGHLPGLRWPGGRPARAEAAAHATARLAALLPVAPADAGLAAMLTVASVNTTVAGLPRAVAWCADARLWTAAATAAGRARLVDELLRVVAPTPLLPRVAAAAGSLGGCPVRPGDRLLLVARHAVGAHHRDPDCARPAPPGVSQLVFGAGPHACPGARLARAQLDDVLAALAPHRPVVVRARADRHAALPGWAQLWLRRGGDA
jgi:cytochrome P450